MSVENAFYSGVPLAPNAALQVAIAAVVDIFTTKDEAMLFSVGRDRVRL